MRWVWVAIVSVACGHPQSLPPECEPSAICPGATSIDVDASGPTIHFLDGGVQAGGPWWVCVCGTSGGLTFAAPDAYDWSGVGHTEAQQCLIFRSEWECDGG